MKTIEVSDSVYAFLQSRAQPFEDAPDDVLRRLLSIQEPDGAGAGGRSRRSRRPSNSGQPRDGTAAVHPVPFSDVASMRADAMAQIDAVLGRHRNAGDAGEPRESLVRGSAREQRLVTPRGQVIYLRTRSFSRDRPPFFTVQPRTFADADWYVFVCGGRGHLVAPAAELRQLAPGLHQDSGGDYKPTFVVDHERCAIYAFGTKRDVSAWRDAYGAIGRRERALPPTGGAAI